ncbi:hypothetical protein EPICR_10289 [Candidatus Desulfarcum epimagneticum]|uniref:Uncharacterized protein n=1 Tax=uncultured Desulfobacteraceae bacterium TaxID=218296 RepID=A0A484HGL6_9BACT|nr:hypothetical protein EPICR_10289 [uncultured Desulfobacteraceae bacterium]
MFENLLEIAATVTSATISGNNPSAGLAVQKISATLFQKENASLEEIERAINIATPRQLQEIGKIESKFKGIKETTEFVDCMILLATFLARELRENSKIDTSLFVKLQNSPSFLEALEKASSGAAGIPAEIDDLDLEEHLELGILGLKFIAKVLKALRGE